MFGAIPCIVADRLLLAIPRWRGRASDADLLAAAVNSNLGGWPLSPVASEIEAQTVRWIAELVGFPIAAGSS
jgi:glutamate/tyrosine decarboxylase-like PLP-dependent enzyme